MSKKKTGPPHHLPGYLWLVHDGSGSVGQEGMIFEECDDAVAMADELAGHEGAAWYVAQMQPIDSHAYATLGPSRRKRRK